MIRTMAITTDYRLKRNLRLNELQDDGILWYWVDFDKPSKEESDYLTTHFRFHHLAIEDCLHGLQRPKAEMYADVPFYVFHTMNQATLLPIELDLFLNERFLVTYHDTNLQEIDKAWILVSNTESSWTEGSVHAFYVVMDQVVDQYFPSVFALEERISSIDENLQVGSKKKLLDQLFEVRSDLQKIKRISHQMSELLYNMIYTEGTNRHKEKHFYFRDVYDHLLRINDLLEFYQGTTSEIRDSYVVINSYRMNRVMMLLTVMTTIFIPLTFIVGVYGMNFDFMPELRWRYGYFIIMGGMLVIAVGMYLWFKLKGWFDID